MKSVLSALRASGAIVVVFAAIVVFVMTSTQLPSGRVTMASVTLMLAILTSAISELTQFGEERLNIPFTVMISGITIVSCAVFYAMFVGLGAIIPAEVAASGTFGRAAETTLVWLATDSA